MLESWRSEINYLNSNLPEVCNHTFYAPPLTDSSIVVDLGGSTAVFSHALASTYGCNCHVVEAASQNFAQIQESDRVRKYHFTITGSNSPVTLHLVDDEHHWGSVDQTKGFKYSATEEVQGISFESFLNEIGCLEPDLVKIDIEGAEIDMFETASDNIIQGVGQFTVEFHDFLDISYQVTIRQIIERLKSIGFICFVFTRRYHGDVLFINSNRYPMNFIEEFYIRRCIKNTRGMMRIIHRYRI